MGQRRINEMLVRRHALHVGGARLRIDVQDAVEVGDVETGAGGVGAVSEEIGGALRETNRAA